MFARVGGILAAYLVDLVKYFIRIYSVVLEEELTSMYVQRMYND
jgi:hypothetical protein